MEGVGLTRFPTESRDVQGLTLEEWPQELPKIGPYCAVPGCTKAADHAHHLFSRGMMGGAFNWVRLPNGNVTGNLMPLCFSHHEQVTNNQVVIQYDMSNGFQWVDSTLGRSQLMQYQPPLAGASETDAVVSNGNVVSADNGHVHDERAICPTCERPMPRPKIESDPEAAKERKTWAVSVPADRWEDGADVLDGLLEAARDELDKVGLSYGEGKKVKYAILATSLALFVQHAELILADA